MKQRCYDENASEFKRYGKRGIRVSDLWINDYKAFKKWSLQNGYSDSLSIDRINVDGNYEPSNCKWSTPKEQANNRRNSLFVEYKGKRQTLAQWSEDLNIPYSCLYGRFINGWEMEDMFNGRSNIIVEYKGIEKPLRLWAKELNFNYRLVWKRLKRGWEFERAFTTPSSRKIG